jgi:hypothetical protein
MTDFTADFTMTIDGRKESRLSAEGGADGLRGFTKPKVIMIPKGSLLAMRRALVRLRRNRRLPCVP